MRRYTIALSEIGHEDLPLVGGKAANLGEMIRRGFPVPGGFVVTTSAYRDVVVGGGLAGCAAGQLRERLARVPVPDDMADAVRCAYRQLGAAAVAVRSSGTAEDHTAASFAGQHDTFLDVTGEEALLAAVRACWASLWSERAVEYRRHHRWSEQGLAMAVVVQTMVAAEWSGVMFTVDPVGSQRDRVVVEAVRGLGEPLVSGRATGIRHVVAKTDGAVTAEGSPLPAGALRELVELGTALEDAFDAPQDVEWTFAGGRCSLVQTRPLTALPPDGDERRERRQRLAAERRRRGRGRMRNAVLVAAEHAPVPPYPMDASVFLRPAIHAALTWLHRAGFTTPSVHDVLTGVEDGAIVIVPPRVRPTPRALVRAPVVAPRTAALILRARPAAWLARCEATLVPLTRRLDGEELTGLSDLQLLDRLAELRSAAGELFPARFACFPRGRLATKLLLTALRSAAGADQAPRLHADLLSAVPCITHQANQHLRRIAASIRSSQRLREVYGSVPPAEIPARLRGFEEGEALLGEVDAYVRSYGYWKTSTPSVGLPALRDTPQAVHGQLVGLSRAALNGDAGSRAWRARAELCDGGLRMRMFGTLALRLSAPAREFVGFREDSHYHLYAVFAVARRYVLELGRRLVERDVLQEQDDILFLELAEARTLPGPDARAVVARRKAAREATMADYVDIADELAQQHNTERLVSGTPASRGAAVGQVRVVRGEDEFAKLEPGDVLVCPYTNPAWTPLFGLASAVVVDTGGTTSHSAIVAREYGIPAVMGTGNGTVILSDGQWVSVSGEHGTVTLLDEADVTR